VMEYGGIEDEAIAALLHDVLEDAGEYAPDLSLESLRHRIERCFGADVLNIVEHCTDTTEMPKPSWPDRKARYVRSLDHAPSSALRVSAADKFHNVQSLIRDYRAHGEELWARFNPEAGKSGTLDYYRSLVTVFKFRMPGALSDDLDRAFRSLEELTR
jgi:(p)ppGpp synthase/HD superfamily hydrolase